jgi:hypothetical protein
VLRTYAIPCGTIGDEPLTPDEEAALTCLIDAISTQVTIVLSRSELAALAGAVERISSALNRERLRERLLLDRSSCGAGLQVLDGSMSVGARKGVLELLLEKGRVDAVLLPVSGGKRSAPRAAAKSGINLVDAAREVKSMPVDQALGNIAGEHELAVLFQPLFRFCEELIVIDPYLGVEALREIAGERWTDEGLRFVVQLASRTAKAMEHRLVIRIVCSLRQFDSELRKQLKRTATASASRLRRASQEAVRAEVVSHIRRRVGEHANDVGIDASQIEIKVHWVHHTCDRGCISSGRVWRVEHSLQTLSELLNAFRSGKRVSGGRARLQLLQAASADEIRRLATEAEAC